METEKILTCPNCGDSNFEITFSLIPEQFKCHCKNCDETYILEVDLEELK